MALRCRTGPALCRSSGGDAEMQLMQCEPPHYERLFSFLAFLSLMSVGKRMPLDVYRLLSNKESTCGTGEAKDLGSIPGSGRSLGGGHGTHRAAISVLGQDLLLCRPALEPRSSWLQPVLTTVGRQDTVLPLRTDITECKRKAN